MIFPSTIQLSQKIILTGFVYFLTLFAINAQTSEQNKIDSLEKWVAQYPKKDTVWIKNLVTLEKLYYTQKPDKIGIYAYTIIENSKEQNYQLGIAKGLASLAYKYIQNGKYEDAIKTIFQKLGYDEKANNTYEKINSYSILGYLYSLTGTNKEKALESYLKGKEFALQLPEGNPKRKGALIAIYANLNMSYVSLGRYEEGIKTSFKALSILKEQKEKRDINYFYQVSAILLNIGDVYSKIKKYRESNIYIKEGIGIALKNNIKIGLPRFYAALSNNYIYLKQFDIAYQELLPLKKMYDAKTLSTEEVDIYLKRLEKIEEGKQQYQKAYYILKKRELHTDSIKSIEQQNRIQELIIKYETEQKEQKNKLLQVRNEKVSAQNQVFTILIVAGIVLLALSLGFYLQIRKKNTNLSQLNAVKDRLFSIIAHDLKKPALGFQTITESIQYLLKLKKYDRLDAIGSQAEHLSKDMNLLLDNLFRWGLLQQGKQEIRLSSSELIPLVLDMQEEYKSTAEEKKINFKVIYPPENIWVHTDKTILSSVLRNVLSNAFKFTPQNGNISLEISIKTNHKILIVIKDSGMGIPSHIMDKIFILDTSKSRKGTKGEEGSGLGLLLVKELLDLSGGKIQIDSTEGHETIVQITLTNQPNTPQ